MKRLYDMDGRRAPGGGDKAGENLITLTVGPLAINCYIYWDESTKKAFVIDPGGEVEIIEAELKRNSLTVEYVVNTHGHFDHVGGNADIKAATGAPVAIHTLDAGLMAEAQDRGIIFGVKVPRQPRPDTLFEDGSVLKAGGLSLEVIHTPGHTKGGVCLFDREGRVLFTGDTLFAGSVGRTDMEGGSYEDLMESIKTRVLSLGDEVRVLPGHGPETTIGEEKEKNPFIMNMQI